MKLTGKMIDEALAADNAYADSRMPTPDEVGSAFARSEHFRDPIVMLTVAGEFDTALLIFAAFRTGVKIGLDAATEHRAALNAAANDVVN